METSMRTLLAITALLAPTTAQAQIGVRASTFSIGRFTVLKDTTDWFMKIVTTSPTDGSPATRGDFMEVSPLGLGLRINYGSCPALNPD